VVARSFRKGPKGTVGTEEFFGLMYECLHMTRTEQAFVVDNRLRLHGATSLYGMGHTLSKQSLRRLPKRHRRCSSHDDDDDDDEDDAVGDAAACFPPIGFASDEGELKRFTVLDSDDSEIKGVGTASWYPPARRTEHAHRSRRCDRATRHTGT
jgi:hypothetical protein